MEMGEVIDDRQKSHTKFGLWEEAKPIREMWQMSIHSIDSFCESQPTSHLISMYSLVSRVLCLEIY